MNEVCIYVTTHTHTHTEVQSGSCVCVHSSVRTRQRRRAGSTPRCSAGSSTWSRGRRTASGGAGGGTAWSRWRRRDQPPSLTWSVLWWERKKLCSLISFLDLSHSSLHSDQIKYLTMTFKIHYMAKSMWTPEHFIHMWLSNIQFQNHEH